MKMRPLLRSLFVAWSLFSLVSLVQSEEAHPTKTVLWVPLNGTVELGLSPYIKRAIKYAEEKQVDALVLDIDTFGGRVDAAVEIRDALLNSKINTVAWINKRAISAGALISFACKKIYFTPGSTMGAATPISGGMDGAKDVGKKYVSYFRGEMGSTAEQNGRPRKIAEAMVQSTEDIKDLVKEGDVLTLTDISAKQVGVSDGTMATKEDLLRALKLEGANIENFEINWAEKAVRFLTDPTVSGLLMSGGILGIIFELKAPGFGLPGVLGISCFVLFFFGKFLVNLAGWEEVLLLIIGFILVFLEFFVFPGTFILAIVGFAAVLIALFLAGLSPHMPFDISFPAVEEQIQSMAIALVSFVFGVGLLLWYIAKNPHRFPLNLQTSLGSGGGLSEIEVEEFNSLLSQAGRLVTDLHPSGKAEINGKVYQVFSDGGYLERGQLVEVVEVQGSKIVVQSKQEKS